MNSKQNLFNPIKSKRIFEVVSAKIKDQIIKGFLKPGDKLPTEGQLAKQFDVGRQTVREALRILELSGIISVQQGSGGGPIVKNNISSKITNLFLDAFQMETISVAEFSKARLIIEKTILHDAIDEADDEDIRNLQENIAKAKGLIAKKEIATEANFDFHSLLAKASRNKVFVILEQTINTIHKKLRERNLVDFEVTTTAIQAHEGILDAILKKDRDKAIYLLEEHIRAVHDSY